jgi:hypothetical protein
MIDGGMFEGMGELFASALDMFGDWGDWGDSATPGGRAARRAARFRFIAVVFAFGGAFHVAAAFMPSLGTAVGSTSPAWRHALFAAMDAALAVAIVKRPPILKFALILLFAQQLTTHGVGLWQAWTNGQGVSWVSLAVLSFLLYVLIEVLLAPKRPIPSPPLA